MLAIVTFQRHDCGLCIHLNYLWQLNVIILYMTVLFRIIIVYTLLCSAYREYFYCHIGLSIPLHSLFYTPKFLLWLYNYATTPCCSVFVLCGNKIVAFSSDSDSCICYNDPSCTQIASLIAVS